MIIIKVVHYAISTAGYEMKFAPVALTIALVAIALVALA